MQIQNHQQKYKPIISPQKKKKWKKQQQGIRNQVTEHNQFVWKIKDLKYVAGVDISFSSKYQNGACAALVIYDARLHKVVYERYQYITLTQQYVPGFLAFRQLPATLHLFTKLKQDNPQFWPQVILVDGNGILHPYQCGYACHLGVIIDVPTIGCAKKFFDIDGLHQGQVEDMCYQKFKKVKDTIPIKGKSGKIWCNAVFADEQNNEHIYISIGTKICLQAATEIVLKLLFRETAQPIFLADRNSRKRIKRMTYQDYKKSNSYEMLYLYS